MFLRPTTRAGVLSRPLSRPRMPKLALVPSPPGNIVGTVNDAYVPPEADYFHGAYHWSYERFVAASLVPLSVVPFAASTPHPVLDALLGVATLAHCHMGLTLCIIDYIPERHYHVWHRLARWVLTFGTVLGGYGVYVIETENDGLTQLCIDLWKAGQEA